MICKVKISSKAQQTSSEKRPIINTLSLWAIQCLSRLFNFTKRSQSLNRPCVIPRQHGPIVLKLIYKAEAFSISLETSQFLCSSLTAGVDSASSGGQEKFRRKLFVWSLIYPKGQRSTLGCQAQFSIMAHGGCGWSSFGRTAHGKHWVWFPAWHKPSTAAQRPTATIPTFGSWGQMHWPSLTTYRVWG